MSTSSERDVLSPDLCSSPPGSPQLMAVTWLRWLTHLTARCLQLLSPVFLIYYSVRKFNVGLLDISSMVKLSSFIRYLTHIHPRHLFSVNKEADVWASAVIVLVIHMLFVVMYVSLTVCPLLIRVTGN